MAASAHHVALRVSDIDRAARFYIDALDARMAVLPFATEGVLAETIMHGPPGVSFITCMLRLADGHLELFQFTAPATPMEPLHASRGNLLHFAVRVDDVGATIARIESSGGRRLWPEIEPWGTAQTMYAADQDGNVIELTNTSMDEIVALTHRMFPQTVPGTD